jgi:hypothetical protein
MSLANRTKKIMMGAAAVGVVTAFSLTSAPIRAQIGGDISIILSAIKQDTGNILQAVNNVPSQLNSIIEAVVALNVTWTQPDGTDTSAKLQSSFATLADTVSTNNDTRASIQDNLVSSLLRPTTGGGMPDYYTVPASLTAQNFPYANDMVFQTLLGKPFLNPDPRPKTDADGNPIAIDPIYNYIKNAAGLNITHAIPSPQWIGTKDARTKYFNFYTTITAIQTYDAYLLSQLYADFAKGPQLTTQQNALMVQASNSDWFAQVASENIGVVLRQILMYNSQIFVMLTQLLQVQKQSLAAQAMTNTLIVIGNQFTESQLLNKATSK